VWEEVDHFPTDAEYADLHRQFSTIEPTPEQLELIRLGIPCFPSDEDEVYVFAVHKVLSPWTRDILAAFEGYYRWTEEDCESAARFYYPALRTALVLTRPDIVEKLREMRRADVYAGAMWDLILLETFKSVLFVLESVGMQILCSYEELDKLDDAAFVGRFEDEWNELMRFRDQYGGFLVLPRVGITHMVRYQQMKRGGSNASRQVSDYLVHLCRERPFVLEALTPLFKEKAFRDRVKSAYQPLLNHLVAKVFRVGKANREEIRGAYGRDVRSMVDEAFDAFLLRFDYYFKRRPEELAIPRWFTMVGRMPDDVRKHIEKTSSLPSPAPVDWDREIAFSHYIEQKLLVLVGQLAGGSDAAWTPLTFDELPEDDELPDDIDLGWETDDGLSDVLAEDKLRTGRARSSKSRNEQVTLGSEYPGYLKINEMALQASIALGVSISPWQLRNWAKNGIIPSERAQTFSSTRLPARRNYWLFRDDEETFSRIVLAARGKAAKDDAGSAGFITRARLAEIAGVNEKTLRRYEKRGLLSPVRRGRCICYSVEQVKAVSAVIRRAARSRPLENSF